MKKQPIEKWLENLPYKELYQLYIGFIGIHYDKFKKYAEKVRNSTSS